MKDKFGIDQIFSSTITSFQSHKIKPDIQLFKDAIADCNSSEIIIVRDNLHGDIEPAQNLGLRTILLDRKKRYPDFENRVLTMDEVEKLIERI